VIVGFVDIGGIIDYHCIKFDKYMYVFHFIAEEIMCLEKN
jgi:hypothetical protein